MSKETSFVKNAEELAKQKMDAINPELSSKFKFLIKFLSQFPEACSKPRSKKMQNKVGQEEHIEYLARSFHESRLPRKPTPPTTVPDEVVSIVLNISFNIQPENLERIKEEHRFSMAAENIVGDLLERSNSAKNGLGQALAYSGGGRNCMVGEDPEIWPLVMKAELLAKLLSCAAAWNK